MKYWICISKFFPLLLQRAVYLQCRKFCSCFCILLLLNYKKTSYSEFKVRHRLIIRTCLRFPAVPFFVRVISLLALPPPLHHNEFSSLFYFFFFFNEYLNLLCINKEWEGNCQLLLQKSTQHRYWFSFLTAIEVIAILELKRNHPVSQYRYMFALVRLCFIISWTRAKKKMHDIVYSINI